MLALWERGDTEEAPAGRQGKGISMRCGYGVLFGIGTAVCDTCAVCWGAACQWLRSKMLL
jgi:hypothetical protein